jgi:hypothetical protein
MTLANESDLSALRAGGAKLLVIQCGALIGS